MARRNARLTNTRLRLLQNASRNRVLRKPSLTRRELTACSELIDQSYLEGWIILQNGKPSRAVDLRITPAGLELLDAAGVYAGMLPRFPKARTLRLLKGLACYLLLLAFLIGLKLGGVFAAPNSGNFVTSPVTKTNRYNVAFERVNVGVCGIPPAE